MSNLCQHMRWVRLGLFALSAALSPTCSYVRFADRGFPPPSPRNKTNENLWMKRKVSLHSDPRPRSGSHFSVCLAEDPGSILGRGVILERFTAHHGQPFENAPQLASPQPDDLACGWTIGAAAFCGHHQAPTSLPPKITTSALLQSMY